MLGQRLRRWPNIKITLIQRLGFAGTLCSSIYYLFPIITWPIDIRRRPVTRFDWVTTLAVISARLRHDSHAVKNTEGGGVNVFSYIFWQYRDRNENNGVLGNNCAHIG